MPWIDEVVMCSRRVSRRVALPRAGFGLGECTWVGEVRRTDATASLAEAFPYPPYLCINLVVPR